MTRTKLLLAILQAGLFLLFPFQIHAGEPLSIPSWNESLEDRFSATISLSSLEPNITDTLSITVNLIYPKDYKPQVDNLRKSLVVNYTLTEPPFAFVQEIAEKPQEIGDNLIRQSIVFLLSPQLTGTHQLALREITFSPIDPKKGSQKQLLSPVFNITVKASVIKFKPEELIAPLMPLTQKIPITISSANRRNFTHNSDLTIKQSKQGLQAVQEKKLPWLIILLAIVFGIVWLLIKDSPETSSAKKNLLNAKPDLPAKTEALQALDQLATEKTGTSFFRTLDHIVRTYINKRYHVDISSITTPEFTEKTNLTTLLPEDQKIALLNFFKENDKRKFADYQPRLQDYTTSEQAVRTFIQQAEQQSEVQRNSILE